MISKISGNIGTVYEVGNMNRLLVYLKNYKKELIFGPFFKLLEAIFELIVPVVMADIIDKGIGGNDSAYILKMSGVIVILGVCGLGFALTCQFLAAKCAYGFGTELRKAMYRHINSLSYSSVDKLGTASIVNRLTNDTNMVQNGVNMFIRLAVRAPFLVIGAAVMAVTIDLKLSLIFFIAAPLISGIIFVIMRKTIPMYKTTQQKLDRAALLTRENIEGTRVIRAFSRQQEEIDEFDQAIDDISSCSIAVGKISAILNPAAFMIMNLGIVAIIWFGGVRINIGSVNRVREVFELAPEESGNEIPDGKYENIVEFRHVSFAYDGAGENSVSALSFTLKRGETLGIIGGTGSGKSTAANLIPRFYRATEGEILVAGKNVDNYDMDSLRGIIGIVPQKAILFSGTVRENMKWRNENATDEEIISALKTAQAWEFIEKMPDLLDTRISQGGKNLSGGQKQRLSIARALVGKPDIIILDDSTSALDYSTDLKLRRALKNDLSGSSVIMISQRTTSLKDADKIIVMDDGSAVGIGNHDELLESCEIYREIYKSQMNEKEGE